MRGACDAREEGKKSAGIAVRITIDEFPRIDLRVANRLKAEHVDSADKLLKVRSSVRTFAKVADLPFTTAFVLDLRCVLSGRSPQIVPKETEWPSK